MTSDDLRAAMDEQLDALAGRDPVLATEVRRKFDATLASRSRVLEARVAGGDNVWFERRDSRRAAEALVRYYGRPVMTIRDNALADDFAGEDSAVWRERLIASKARLDQIIPAVGRIELVNHPWFPWVGTSWLIAHDIVVTNGHVARRFGRRDGAEYLFTPTHVRTSIDFSEEPHGGNLARRISKILWICDDQPDIAFLLLEESDADHIKPIPLSLSTQVDDDVATIGYPAADDSYADRDLLRRFFGDVYDRKRLAPGQLTAVAADYLKHDCSTLGGNSGSPVVNLKTGEAVGLHYAGTPFTANYAVSSAVVQDLLRRVLSRDLPAPARLAAGSPAAEPAITAAAGDTASGADVDTDIAALHEARKALAGNRHALNVRLGYRFREGWITDERVIVVEVDEGAWRLSEESGRFRDIPARIGRLAIDIRHPALATQFQELAEKAFAIPEEISRGHYRPPQHLSLYAVDDMMRAIFHVSPDAGWPTLAPFLRRIEDRLAATMYEFDAEYIRDTLAEQLAPASRRFEFISQHRGESMTDFVSVLQARLGGRLEHVWASVGAGLIFPRAYHIKVAVRDGRELWLSSGNWKTSGQPDIDPIADGTTSGAPLTNYNREWHAVIDHADLAGQFEAFIRYDIGEARRIPRPEGLAEPEWPDLFVPLDSVVREERVLRARYHAPLEVNRRLRVRPLLTPDNYAAAARSLIDAARHRICFQNQSFSLLRSDDDDQRNDPAFLSLLQRLRDRQQEIDVRIIVRDISSYGRGALETQQELLERLADFGFDMSRVRLQPGCHTKGIVVDGETVLLGSHNWTNTGVLYNRDASLTVEDSEVARYFETIFLYDWENLAHKRLNERPQPLRVAGKGEPTPEGMVRISLGTLLE